MTDDPKFMKLGDGGLINLNTGKRAVSTDINKAFSDEPARTGKARATYKGGKRRFLDELPVPTFNSIPTAVIAAYTLFGLTEADIAYLLRKDVADIQAVVDADGFQQFVDAILQNVREHDIDIVRKKLNDAATLAADKIVDLAENGEDKVALSASKDILDRVANGGLSKEAKQQATGFTIRVIEDKDQPSIKVEVDL